MLNTPTIKHTTSPAYSYVCLPAHLFYRLWSSKCDRGAETPRQYPKTPSFALFCKKINISYPLSPFPPQNSPSLPRLLSLHAPPPPPLANTALDLGPGDAVADEPHGDAEGLGVAVAALVVEEQHVGVRDARALVQGLEVADLGRGVDLEPGVEEVDGPAALAVLRAAPFRVPSTPAIRHRHVPVLACGGGGVWQQQAAGRRHVQHLEHVAPEVGRVGAARDAQAHPRERRQGVQHARHVAVEGEGLPHLVRAGAVRRVRPQRRVHVRVYPEGPERVVEVEDDGARERAAVREDRGEVQGGG